MVRIGLPRNGREPFPGAPTVKDQLRPLIHKWLRGFGEREVKNIAGWAESSGLAEIDGNLVSAINALQKEGSVDMRGMMRSLYKLQLKIILLRCDKIGDRPGPHGIPHQLVQDLADALINKVEALDNIMDAKFVRETHVPVSMGGGGAAYKAKKYKYKYLRAKNAI